MPAPDSESGAPAHWELCGLTVREGRRADFEDGLQALSTHDGWIPSDITRPYHHLDPARITQLIDQELVWFDPEHGFVTDKKNLKGNWLDRYFPQIMGAAFAAVGAWGVGNAVAQATGSVVAQGAAAGAVGSALNQYVSTGHVSFKSVLTSALASGLTAGIANLPGVGQHIDGVAGTFGQRLMEYTGRATLQGAIQAVVGGQFKDGFVNSLMASVAGEVSGMLNAEIAEMSRNGSLSESQASTMRLLARATSSALRVVANPGDPAAGFASDFLGGVLGEAVRDEVARAAAEDSAQTPDVDGPTPIDQGKPTDTDLQRWSDRQADLDAYLEIAAASDAFADAADETYGTGAVGDASDDGEEVAGTLPEVTIRVPREILTADDLRYEQLRDALLGDPGSGDEARAELARVDDLLATQGSGGLTRAGLYNQLVLDRFRDLSPAGQMEVLATLDDYANELNSGNGRAAIGLEPGSLEARRADLAMRMAADFARQSGAIPEEVRFGADVRGGVGAGNALMFSAILGRLNRPNRTNTEIIDSSTRNVGASNKLPSIEQEVIASIATANDVVIVGSGSASGTRLPQDINVSPVRPDRQPIAGRGIGASETQNAAMQSDVEYLANIGATDIRINQQQIDGSGRRVGINRPDVQATLPNGRRISIEYDKYSSNRGAAHATRTLNNDPSIIVILRQVD
ncbi:MAG: hypothetical protein QM772_04570 [Ottowia sp.]|uniref:hypothetical protein n=1 Tax=Ottowia sp. TaxID=1898956 RepID=UPI0039E33971